ncbi:MAG: hypothetical protein JXR94_19160, partial [Candidatus Hydrogenedentes bacterium]|nr:hypothetical protein [Candidatus Hydrogenedentota bacterium]
DTGRLLVFDNQGYRGASRIVEVEPLTQRIEWAYAGTPAKPFYSELCGSCQRLPNGNTLITESTYGRAFEVAPEGRIVWEFISPHRAGDHNQLIATLFEVIRLDPAFFDTPFE